MIPKVNKETCIGCGICPALCPNVFRMNEENKAEVIQLENYDSFQKDLDESIVVCPVQAISKE